jgi:hypothetical protein
MTIQSWEEMDQRLADLGLIIETGTEDWIERIVDHANTLKAQRDAGFDFAQRVERYAHDRGDDFLWQKARIAIIEMRDTV